MEGEGPQGVEPEPSVTMLPLSVEEKLGSPLALSASKTPRVLKDVSTSLGLARCSHFSGGPCSRLQ